MRSRSYNHNLISYITKKDLNKTLLDHSSQIRHFAYIRHDKDEGEKKHWHLILVLQDAKSDSAVRKWFPSSHGNTLSQETVDLASSFVYLTHSDDLSKEKGKFQYPLDSVVTDDLDWWTFRTSDKSNAKRRFSAERFVFDILDGVSKRELLARYGREFVLNYPKYAEVAKMLRAEQTYQRIQETGSDVPEVLAPLAKSTPTPFDDDLIALEKELTED